MRRSTKDIVANLREEARLREIEGGGAAHKSGLVEAANRLEQLESEVRELDEESGWFASAVDSINTWAREQGIKELKWDGTGESFVVYLREFHGLRNEIAYRRESEARLPRYTVIRGPEDWPPVGMHVLAGLSSNSGQRTRMIYRTADDFFISGTNDVFVRPRRIIWWTPAPTGPEVRDEPSSKPKPPEPPPPPPLERGLR